MLGREVSGEGQSKTSLQAIERTQEKARGKVMLEVKKKTNGQISPTHYTVC